MTLFRVLYTVVHEFSVLSLEAINIARTQEATSNQLQDIRGIQTTTFKLKFKFKFIKTSKRISYNEHRLQIAS